MKPRVFSARDASHLETLLAENTAEGYQPTLAVVFASSHLISDELCAPFDRRGMTVFGGSSEEEISESELSSGTIATMLLDVNPDFFQHKIFEPEEAVGLGRRVAEWARDSFANPILLLLVGGQGITIDVDLLLSGIFETAPGLPVFGGLTSTTDFGTPPPLFTAQQVHENGISAIVFDNDRIDLRGVAVSGWMEVGTPKRITRASGNVVYEIENMPALDFYERYFKIGQDDILEAREYPIRLMSADGTKVIRVAVNMNAEDKSVIFGGMIPEGSLVRFCSPNIVETIQHTVDQLQSFRAGQNDSAAAPAAPPPQPDAVILFDCAIRSHAFGRYMQRELRVIKELWNVPMVGFSSWGEIGNAPGQACGFHNTVISTVLIHDRERDAPYEAPRSFSDEQVATLVDAPDAGATVESLQREVAQLRKQKTMLSHFLHLTSEDLDRERRKSDELLLNILPGPVADRLKQGERVIADSAEAATILFTDIVGFTALSASMSAPDLVRILNRLFSNFDELAYKYGVEKIKTIGDAYMAVAGLPDPRPDHAAIALKLGKGLLKIMELFNEKYGTELQIRVGLNTGQVVAGVIGKRKFSYDLWGDAVNVASRMESNGIPGRIHVSDSTYELLKDTHAFESRGSIEIKGKGRMETYLYRS